MNSIREQLHEFLKENCDNGYGLDYADLHEQQQREIIEDLLQNLEDGQVRLKGKYVKVGKSDLFEVAGERLRNMNEDLRCNGTIDQRWVDISETHLQQGIMAAVRSIAQPNSF